MIYLDNAATTFPKPEFVYSEMDRINRSLAVNAGRGSYKAAKEAAKIIDETRQLLLKLFHAQGIADIILTPSITHAINQILGGLADKETATVYISPYEHNAVARTLNMLQEKYRFDIEFIPLDDDLKIDLKKTEYQFTQKAPSIVIINKISNVTGYILPVEQVFHIAKKYGAVTIMDAAQAAGLVDIDMTSNDADIICFAGHKTLYGPLGIGGFALKHGIELQVTFAGGTGSNSLNLKMPDRTPARYEAASQNILAVAGLHAALSVVDQKQHLQHSVEMTDYLLTKLSSLTNIKLMGTYSDGSTLGIVSFVVDGYTSDDIGNILDDEFDIAVRTGYHCAPYIHEYLKDKDYAGTVRIGTGLFTTKEDVDRLIEALETL
jgi:cysteine desulfurase family protein